jgi:PKHD-type hydroxylase
VASLFISKLMEKIYLPLKSNKHLMSPVIIPGVFTNQECNRIVQDFKNKNLLLHDNEANRVKAYSIDFTNDNYWLFEKITSVLDEVNRLFFHFDLTDIRDINFLKYEKDCFMEWHRDINSSSTNFLTRKITISIFLSEPESYEGGKLIFKPDNKIQFVQHQGTAILYPSYVLHRVEKIINGERFIIIASAHGQPFR